MSNISLKLSMLAVCVVFMYIVGGRIEGRTFPVFSNVELTRMEAAENGYTRIWGTFQLDRDNCDFVSLQWFLKGAERNVGADLVFEGGTEDRANGVQVFGPWRVQLTKEQLTQRSGAIARHACPYRWWETETEFYP